MSTARRKLRIVLIEQSVWRSEGSAYLAMPLASGYLKATVLADPGLARACSVEILNFAGTEGAAEIIQRILADGIPDIVAFSVLGWNYATFGQVATALRQLDAGTWIVWGGNHASQQAARTAILWPAVDITVNGEGERTFRDLVGARLGGLARDDLGVVQGLTLRRADGSLATTPARARIEDLDTIPSPILTGAIPLRDRAGRFPYDYALIETNRGCPYACAFCYWGGAIGQKVRRFSLQRLEAEIERLAELRVPDIMLCDANFGMLREDEDFLEICIRARERHGFPRHIMTSWAKNKGRVFYRMVRRMRETGFHSAFNLALQSIDEPVLEAMGRKNMKINDWESLAAWLRGEGLDVYGELIWGCPGETVDSFLEGYDALARHVTRIAVYPLLLMPNTDYAERRDAFGFVTWRTNEHDFELVLAHNSMTVEDNRRMHAFLFWARVVAEHLVFRHIWAPLHTLAGVTQSQVLRGLDAWLDAHAGPDDPRGDFSGDPLARQLVAVRNRVVESLEASSRHIEAGLQLLYGAEGVEDLLTRWWRADMLGRVAPEHRVFFDDLFRYDLATLPVYRRGGEEADLPEQEIGGERLYRRDNVAFDYDVPALSEALRQGEQPAIRPQPITGAITYRKGFCNDMRLYHNAHNLAFFGVFRPAGTGAGSRSDAPIPQSSRLLVGAAPECHRV